LILAHRAKVQACEPDPALRLGHRAVGGPVTLVALVVRARRAIPAASTREVMIGAAWARTALSASR
jgi:hypothetical protein